MRRRGFLKSILIAAAAPAIVRADSLMRIVPREALILDLTPADSSLWNGLVGFTGVRGDMNYINGRVFAPNLGINSGCDWWVKRV